MNNTRDRGGANDPDAKPSVPDTTTPVDRKRNVIIRRLLNDLAGKSCVPDKQGLLVRRIGDIVFSVAFFFAVYGISRVLDLIATFSHGPLPVLLRLLALVFICSGAILSLILVLQTLLDSIRSLINTGAILSIGTPLSNAPGRIRRFGKVVKRQWVSASVGILLTWAFLVIEISMAENLENISDHVYILGVEMVTESGPKPKAKEALSRHIEILEAQKGYLQKWSSENAPLRAVAASLKYPVISLFFRDWKEHTPEEGIDKALTILNGLEKGASDRQILEAIWTAGEELVQFREGMIRFGRPGRIRIGFHENSGDPPPKLKRPIEDAIRDCNDKTVLFKRNQSWEAAWYSCEANREAVLLWSFDYSTYRRGEDPNRDPSFKSLCKIIESSGSAKKEYSETLPKGSEVRRLVTHFWESDERRVGILTAIGNHDLAKARYLLWEAKEKAKTIKAEILEIDEKMESGRGDAQIAS